MEIFMGAFIIVMIAAAIIYIIFNISLLYLKKKMKLREQELKNAGVTPSGSGLCHGMKLNSTKKGVIRDSKKSSAWYSRLA
jgi:predicted membrane protein